MNEDKEQLISFAEKLYKEAFDANAYYLILQQYQKNQHDYPEEMKISPAFYHSVYEALIKACFMEIAKLFDASNDAVSIGTLLTRCTEHQDFFPEYRETMNVEYGGRTFSYPIPYQHRLRIILRVRIRPENHMRRERKFTDSICRVVVQFDDCFLGQESCCPNYWIAAPANRNT